MARWTLLLLVLKSISIAAEPSVQWTGDLRLRSMIEKKGDAQARFMERLRARFGLAIQVQEDLRVEMRVASAKGGRSSNQTLGDSSEPGSRRRYIGLDLAYAKYSPFEFLNLYLGRFNQVHFAPGGSEVILDDDLSLEGAGFFGEYSFYPSIYVFADGGSTFIRENYDTYYSEDLADNMINFGQVGLQWKETRAQITLGAGFFNFTSVQGKNFADLASGGKPYGNSESPAGAVAYPYLPRQYFVEVKLPAGSLDTKTFFELVENHEAPSRAKAFWTGAEIGQKSWDLSLAYTEVESDAVMAIFTASDVGDGVTNVRGWVGKARWKFARNMNLKLTQMVNRTDMTDTNKEYRRTQLDLNASF